MCVACCLLERQWAAIKRQWAAINNTHYNDTLTSKSQATARLLVHTGTYIIIWYVRRGTCNFAHSFKMAKIEFVCLPALLFTWIVWPDGGVLRYIHPFCFVLWTQRQLLLPAASSQVDFVTLALNGLFCADVPLRSYSLSLYSKYKISTLPGVLLTAKVVPWHYSRLQAA